MCEISEGAIDRCECKCKFLIFFFFEKFPLFLSLLLAPFSLQQLTKLSDCVFVSPNIFLFFFFYQRYFGIVSTFIHAFRQPKMRTMRMKEVKNIAPRANKCVFLE